MAETIAGRRIGIVVNVLVASAMIADGLVGLLRTQLYAPVIACDGWGQETVLPIALLALLGAILITGFAGGRSPCIYT